MSKLKKIKGCIFGLAIGDALGYPIEFLRWDKIKSIYGNDGITDFEPIGILPEGSYTDDTQMSLSTAYGLLNAYKNKGKDYYKTSIHEIYKEYLKWVNTQNNDFYRRSPGITCTSVLRRKDFGTIDEPVNMSKGCGGVMRTAPIGLISSKEQAFKLGAEAAAITHGHPSGYLSAGFLSELIYYIVEGYDLLSSIEYAKEELIKYDCHVETLDKINQAITLSKNNNNDMNNMITLGEGWVGEEALAVALYCSLKYQNDFHKALLVSVNHSGDSDSTGSITGAILGTLLSIEAIPETWINRIENKDELNLISEQLYEVVKDNE